MIASVKFLLKSFLIAALGICPSVADGVESYSKNLEPILLVQNYSKSDSSTTKTDSSTETKKHDNHDDHPLFRYSYEISAADDDNIGRAQKQEDIREDVGLTLKLKARGGTPLGRTSMLAYGGSLAYEKFDVFDDLNNFTFDTHIKYRFVGKVCCTGLYTGRKVRRNRFRVGNAGFNNICIRL